MGENGVAAGSRAGRWRDGVRAFRKPVIPCSGSAGATERPLGHGRLMSLLRGFLVGTLILAAGAVQAQPSALEGRVVVDQAGRRVNPEKPFTRIISLYGAHTENLFALGLDSEIIGVTRNEKYPAAALEKKVFSYHDDPEKFLAARPDLVLVRPMIERGYGGLIRRLERSGITVVSLQPGSVEDLFRYWRILGRLTGRAEAAEDLAGNFRKGVRMMAGLSEGVHPRKRVYFEAIHRRMRTFAPGSMAIFALKQAGGINVAADATPRRGTNIADYGKERILSKAGEIDLYLAQRGVMNRVTASGIAKAPGYRAIPAVREGRVFLVDEMIVSRPSFRLLNGIFAIGRILYPDRFNGEAAERIERSIPGLRLSDA